MDPEAANGRMILKRQGIYLILIFNQLTIL